ncbi:methyl-accepting chemotaxis protein [Pseudaeromonas paramecii]|uniref:Methyl-accepting chemotaxis protein n=1 Tax=Pseudaeromonas paramecii TaxID=2138166 RepID=A0ABP8Q314_9GAMM
MQITSLKTKILLAMATALFIVVALMSWNSYLTLKGQLMQQSFLAVKGIGEQSAITLETWLAGKKTAVQTLAKFYDQGDITQNLQQAQQAANLALAFYGDDSGRMFDADPSIDRTGYDPRQRDWYIDAKKAGGILLTKPYVSASLKELIVSYAQAVDKGVVAGVVTLSRLLNTLEKTPLPANGQTLVIHKDGTVIAFADKQWVLKPVSELDPQLSADQIQQIARQPSLTPVEFLGQKKLVWAIEEPSSQWVLVFLLDADTLLAPLKTQLLLQLGVALAVLVGSILLTGLMLNVLFRPLAQVSQALRNIASGAGDLTQRISIRINDEIGALATNFNQFVESQHQLIGHIRQQAGEIGESAGLGLSRSEHSAEEVRRQQHEIGMVATAVTEMAAATQEIASNAENTAAMALEASQHSEHGRSTVVQTGESIGRLSDEVSRATEVIELLNRHALEISGVVTTIQGIAEQTNLLALNAAIEAARAGEQGRGFAVVADEVRVLSKRTATATSEIQNTINTLQGTTQDAVDSMTTSRKLAELSVDDARQARDALEQITLAVTQITDMSAQIATAAEEQTKVSDEISSNLTAISDAADQVAEIATQSEQTAHELQKMAAALNGKVAHFTL